MNNPFGGASANSNANLNNPFDTDPTLAKNRFPDLNDSWAGPMQQQAPYGALVSQSYQPANTQAPTPYAAANYGTQSYSAFTGSQGSPPMGYNPSSSAPPWSGTSASGGGYMSFGPPAMTSPSATGYGPYSYLNGGGVNNRPMTAPPPSLHPQLSQFDPLSPNGVQQSQQSQFGYGGGGGNTSNYFPNNNNANSALTFSVPGLDPRPLQYHPRQLSNPQTLSVTGFNGATTIHIRTRGHRYTPQDHPRTVVQHHKHELEQWDQYGWKQCLNAFESLRLSWEYLKQDVDLAVREGSAGLGLQERAILGAIQKDASENIDIITAAYLQMQEVYSNYRQSQDAASKTRVKDCLNAGLRGLPDWP